MKLLLPSVLPDEALYSLIARIAKMNGIGHRELVGLLMGQEHPLSALNCPIDIHMFYKSTQGVYGSALEILQNQTVLPLLAHLGEIEPSYLLSVEAGECQLNMHELMIGMRSGWKFKICIQCARLDRAKYGAAYWHREHQLPISYCCVEHGIRLSTISVKHIKLHEHLVLPYEVMDMAQLESDQYTENISNSKCYALAKLARTAIADFGMPISSASVVDTFTDAISQMGLLNEKGELNYRKYEDEFKVEFGNDVHFSLMMTHAKISNPKQLLSGVANRHKVKPFGRLLLVQWIFERWGSYKEKCGWNEMLESGSNSKDVNRGSADLRSRHQIEVKLQQCRKICLDFKNSLSSPTRLEFLKVHYRAFKWLRDNDRKWLDNELPMVRQVKGQLKLF
ncbi:MAG: TniQ family protein [Gallionella sp.]